METLGTIVVVALAVALLVTAVLLVRSKSATPLAGDRRRDADLRGLLHRRRWLR